MYNAADGQTYGFIIAILDDECELLGLKTRGGLGLPDPSGFYVALENRSNCQLTYYEC